MKLILNKLKIAFLKTFLFLDSIHVDNVIKIFFLLCLSPIIVVLLFIGFNVLNLDDE